MEVFKDFYIEVILNGNRKEGEREEREKKKREKEVRCSERSRERYVNSIRQASK